MDNSNITILKLVESSDKTILSGTKIEIKCHEGYKIPANVSTCGQDGKWTPALFCYPGFALLYIKTKFTPKF